MRHDPDQDGRTSLRRRLRNSVWPVLKSLALVGVTTIGLLILDQFFALRHVTLVYLVPVVIAATKLGIVPAVIAAIAGGGASAFFFYPPIYSFLVQDPQHLIELPLFVFVAIVTAIWQPISKDRLSSRAAVKPKCRICTRSRASSPLPTPQATSTPLSDST